MNSSVLPANGQDRYFAYSLFFFASVAITFSISSQSLWIDEGTTVWFASQSSLEGVLDALLNAHRAESLMPGYVLYLWAWIKGFGSSEFYLRFSNAPLMIFVLFLFVRLPLNRIFKTTVVIITCLNPFLWYYMNEVRSYIALFSFSAMGLSGLVFYFRGGSRWKRIGPNLTITSLFFGSFFNMSCVFTVPAILAAGFLFHQEERGEIRKLVGDWARPVLFAAPFFLILGGYYLWMVLEGAGGGRLQQHDTTPNLRHIVFVFYEFFGFMGLGPPRNILRTSSSLGALNPYLVWVIPFAVLLIGLAGAVVVFSRKFSYEFFKSPYLWGFVVGLLFFMVFAFVSNFIFYGRHVIFLYPYFIFVLALVMSEAWRTQGVVRFRLVMAVGLLLMFLVSDLRLKFDPEYSKDNYKLAVGTAISLSNLSAPIYWAAHYNTGAYYGLFYSNVDPSNMQLPPTPASWSRMQKALYASNWSHEDIRREIQTAESVVLVLSKFDLFDNRGGWRSFIENNEPAEIKTFGAFRIYRFEFDQDRSG